MILICKIIVIRLLVIRISVVMVSLVLMNVVNCVVRLMKLVRIFIVLSVEFCVDEKIFVLVNKKLMKKFECIVFGFFFLGWVISVGVFCLVVFLVGVVRF